MPYTAELYTTPARIMCSQFVFVHRYCATVLWFCAISCLSGFYLADYTATRLVTAMYPRAYYHYRSSPQWFCRRRSYNKFYYCTLRLFSVTEVVVVDKNHRAYPNLQAWASPNIILLGRKINLKNKRRFFCLYIL